MSNITQVVGNEKTMTTLNRGIAATGLAEALSQTGPFTIFAPSDLAFGKLETKTLESLFKPENKAKLTLLVNRHVVPGKINFKDLKNGDKLKTRDGKELSVRVTNAKVSIDGATIGERDLQSSNGIIHTLDTVLSQ